MGVRFQYNSAQNGFLLMEALLAILVFASMSVVIGSYWYHISKERERANRQLNALVLASSAIDKLLYQNANLQIQHFGNAIISFDSAPITIQNNLLKDALSASLITITVKDNRHDESPILLQTIIV